MINIGFFSGLFNKNQQQFFIFLHKYNAEKYGVARMPEKEGLKIPEMLEAAIEGKFKALWIMGEDTLMTDPNTMHIRKAMEQLDIMIVQELFMSATAEMADVVLPASSYFEKNGTFTNGERRVQRVNKVIEPIGNTKSDGQMIIDMMSKLGYEQPTGKVYDAELLLEEISGVIPFMKGISWNRLGENGLQWPILENGSDTKIIHKNENYVRFSLCFLCLFFLNRSKDFVRCQRKRIHVNADGIADGATVALGSGHGNRHAGLLGAVWPFGINRFYDNIINFRHITGQR